MNDRGIQIANEAYKLSSSPVSFDVKATDGLIHNFPWTHYVESEMSSGKLVIWTSSRMVTIEGLFLEDIREEIRKQFLSFAGPASTITMNSDHRCFINKIMVKST